MPPEYGDLEIDYALGDEVISDEMLNDFGLQNYDSVEKVLKGLEMTPHKTRGYLNKIIKDAKFRSNQLKGYSQVSPNGSKAGLCLKLKGKWKIRE